MSTDRRARAWMELRADAICRNLASIRASVGPEVRLLPMVKADAYGTGVEGAVAALAREGLYGFGVAAVEEGVQLRAMGVRTPVLVLSPAPPASLRAAVDADLTVSISSLESLQLLRDAADGRRALFHLEVDTGMGRAGFDWRGGAEWGPPALEAHASGVRWAGCFTHMHSADEARSPVDEQWRRLQEALASVRRPEGEFLVHGLNSAASLRCPEFAADLVRPGIFLYGGRAGADQQEPEAVASVHARIVHVRSAPPGTTLGYGVTYRSKGDERWATVAMGYGDGLPRSLGNRGHALVAGRRVPIVGRISMDVSVVDITGVDGVRLGDVATFIGTDGGERISVDEVADLVGTISYEILTGFTPRVPRIWVDVDGGSSDGS